MFDAEQRVKELEFELKVARLEAEFARDREKLVNNGREQIFSVFKELSQAQEKETQYAVLINVMRRIVVFEHVVLLAKDVHSNNDNLDIIYASHEKLRKHTWKSVGVINQAFNGSIMVLNDPSVAKGFENEDFEFNQITRSAMLIPLFLQETRLLFICTHHIPLSLDLRSKREVKLFQPFLAQAVISIEYRSHLEEAVASRTKELIDLQTKQRVYRNLSYEIYWQIDRSDRFVPVVVDAEKKINANFDKHDLPKYESIIGKSFFEILDMSVVSEERFRFFEDIRKRKEFISDLEAPIVVNGYHYWVRINGEPYFDEDGDYLGYRGTACNITKEHNQTFELQTARDSAEIANRSKTEYLAVMSHEIKTPLQAILGMLDLLEQTDINDTQRSYIKHVSQSASLLQTILHDVLDLSKIESQAMVLENLSFDIQFALKSTIVQMQEKADAKGIELTLTLGDRFPKIIVGDQHRLSQILFNLINNAIKFTSQGGVYVTAERFENRLKFSVTDTGTGIPPEHLEDLFLPFVQLDGSISRKFGGTGLGLAICKRLVEHMGGKIGIRSELGKGSTFWFEIPCKVPTTNIIGVNAIHKPFVHKERHYNILLVEDSQINQFVIKTMLEKLGHNVRLASNGVEAINAVRERIPELIFMDLRMPIMDGIEATKNIVSEFGKLPIVALSANTSDEERIECRKAGMLSIASKPVNTEILKKILAELEGVIDETNQKLIREGVIQQNVAPTLEDTDNGNDKSVAHNPIGAVSSQNTKSNAALIDALIKNMLGNNTQPSGKNVNQRTDVSEK